MFCILILSTISISHTIAQHVKFYSLLDLWPQKGILDVHLFPTLESTVHPRFAGIRRQENGLASFIHLNQDGISRRTKKHQLHSVFAYDYLNSTFYVVNIVRGVSTSIVVCGLSLDQLQRKADKMTAVRASPSYISADVHGEKFSAVWHTDVPMLRHFEIRLRPLEEMNRLQRTMTRNGYYPDSWEVFRTKNTTMALVIWRKGFGVRYNVQYGESIVEMERVMNSTELTQIAFSNLPRKKPSHPSRMWLVWHDLDFTWQKFEEIPRSTMGSEDWKNLDALIEKQMRSFDIPSISICVSKNGETVYNEAYGSADLNLRREAQPNSVYRVASISKTITAMGITHLIKRQQLSLKSFVFGKTGLLNQFSVHSSLKSIRIIHLLEHSSGAWSHLDKQEFNRKETNQTEFIENVLRTTKSNYLPGATFQYSNLGYVLLGMIIEKISGTSYETFLRETILNPLNITGTIGNTDAGPNEVTYYSQDNANPYEHWSPQLLGPAAGWTFSSSQLALLFSHLDENRYSLYNLMTQPSTVSSRYGRGIQIYWDGSLYHFGSLAGTESIAYTRNGIQVVILSNVRGRVHNEHTEWMKILSRSIIRGMKQNKMR